MKKIILHFTIRTACFFLCYNTVQAQSKRTVDSLRKQPAQIEINQYFNFDKYSEFRYSPNPTYDHVINIKGNSWGLDIGYKFNLFKNVYIKPFLGYYKFSFDKIDNYNEGFGLRGNARQTTLTPGQGIYYIISSDKYLYHCFNAGVSVEKNITHGKPLLVAVGGAINNYFTISQTYFITYDNPDNPVENPHKTNRTDLFGFRTDLFAKFLMPIKKINVGATIGTPIYTLWKTDAFFPYETNKGSRDKWFKGIGVGISVNYLLNSKNK